MGLENHANGKAHSNITADIIVVTEDDVEQFKDHIGMVIRPALEEGKVLYAA